MIQTKLKGMGVALITPFKEDESVDYDALMRMVSCFLPAHDLYGIPYRQKAGSVHNHSDYI